MLHCKDLSHKKNKKKSEELTKRKGWLRRELSSGMPRRAASRRASWAGLRWLRLVCFGVAWLGRFFTLSYYQLPLWNFVPPCEFRYPLCLQLKTTYFTLFGLFLLLLLLFQSLPFNILLFFSYTFWSSAYFFLFVFCFANAKAVSCPAVTQLVVHSYRYICASVCAFLYDIACEFFARRQTACGVPYAYASPLWPSVGISSVWILFRWSHMYSYFGWTDDQCHYVYE